MRALSRFVRTMVAAGSFLGVVGPEAACAQPWKASLLARPTSMATDGASAPRDTTTAPDLARREPALVPAGRVAPAVRGQPSVAWPIVGGLVGATGGAIAGTLIGASREPYSDDIPASAVYGFLIGEGVGLPIGVHLGNAGRGSFLADLGVSVLGGFAALGVGAIGNSGSLYVAGLAAQVGLTVWSERSSAAHRQREAAERAQALDGTIIAPAPPAEPDPLVPPPPPTR